MTIQVLLDEDSCNGTRCQMPNGTVLNISDPVSLSLPVDIVDVNLIFLQLECQSMAFCSEKCIDNGLQVDCVSEAECLLAGICNDAYFDYEIGKCIDTSVETFECGLSQFDNATAREFIRGMGCYEPLATTEEECLTQVPWGRWVKSIIFHYLQ